MPHDHPARAFIDGQPATLDDLIPLAFAGFAHFTAMQIRKGQVRGLDLHLERLRQASTALFGHALSDETVRDRLRGAIGAVAGDLSLSATIFSRVGEFGRPHGADELSVLIRTGPPTDGPSGPLRLATVSHERWLPGIKQVGEGAKTFFLRQAAGQGFDDAAFVDRAGRVSEGTIWNLAFWDGDTVVWPKADLLPGVTMQIVRRRLTELGVPQRDDEVMTNELHRYAGAAVLNSWSPGIAVRAIGQADMAASDRLVGVLHEAYDREPARHP